ncbi:MAG: cobalt ECF transporter T component CbiQ [Muribaculaceae bacterium]|nr:cobalt ECF transporter T component CbiQ [Muribaculaceae bacterium]
MQNKVFALDMAYGRTSARFFGAAIDPRASILVTVVYLCVLLGVPATHIDILLWFALYPIIAAPLYGLRYSRILLKSLIILPLVVLIGVFNPILDKTPVADFNGWHITRGWLLFIGVVLRGLLSMQCLLILIDTMGFVGMVDGMRRLGLPRFLATQLLMVFRYIKVLIEEGLTMRNAIASRSYGAKHLSIRLWGTLVGQLFLRSIRRAENVHNAMLARGFTGEMPFYSTSQTEWHLSSTVYLVSWSAIFVFLRLFNLSLLFV